MHTPTQVCARGSDVKSLATSASDTRTHMHTVHTRTRTRACTFASANPVITDSFRLEHDQKDRLFSVFHYKALRLEEAP